MITKFQHLYNKPFPVQCKQHAGEVSVTLKDVTDDLLFTFSVTSLSRPLSHTVKIKVVDQFSLYRNYRNADELVIMQSGTIKIDSTDEWWRYSGGAYYATVGNYALVPEFRAPKSPNRQYLCGHTVLATLIYFKQRIIPSLYV